MNWYLVKIIFRIICGDGLHAAQFDEQLRLITAESEDEALRKATRIGEQEAQCFFTDKRQLVQWQFVAISELYKLTEWIDGAELYSSLKELDEPEPYLSLLQAKAASLKEENY
jgi:hypothetical protein